MNEFFHFLAENRDDVNIALLAIGLLLMVVSAITAVIANNSGKEPGIATKTLAPGGIFITVIAIALITTIRTFPAETIIN